MTPSRVLASPTVVAERRHDVVVLDASWIYPPLNSAGIDVRRRYAEAHIEGSIFLDLEALSPRPYPSDVPAIAPPPAAALHRALGACGVDPAQHLVVTDMDGGTTTAPFARLALIDAGFEHVRLLDGGTPAWQAQGLPLTRADPRYARPTERPEASPFTTCSAVFADTGTTARAVERRATRIIDARFLDDNRGILPERFAAVTMPTNTVLRPAEVVGDEPWGQPFKSPADLRTIAHAKGLDDARTAIVTCYVGLGAACVATALELAGVGRPRVDAASIVGWAGQLEPPTAQSTS